MDQLETLGDDKTLLIQGSKPVGRFEAQEMAPLVLIADSNLAGNWHHFHELEEQGLMMEGQVTARP